LKAHFGKILSLASDPVSFLGFVISDRNRSIVNQNPWTEFSPGRHRVSTFGDRDNALLVKNKRATIRRMESDRFTPVPNDQRRAGNDPGNSPKNAHFSLSIVVPVYKEEGNVPEFLHRISGILDSITSEYEIVFCLDPSPDRTEEVILQAREQDPRVKLIRFSRRFGQPMATLAGSSTRARCSNRHGCRLARSAGVNS
jgi:cellulose synthase/poly-beta-1,6-N-acetylglucosamine synthase-like glycosyltransferase